MICLRISLYLLLASQILGTYIQASGVLSEQGKDPQSVIDRIRNVRRNQEPAQTSSGKCGLQNFTGALDAWDKFTEEQKLEVQTLLTPGAMQKERIIGRFHIYYDTAGYNEPAMLDQNYQAIAGTAEVFIDSVGKSFNDVWNYEIGVLGYDAPPLADDSTYHVTVRDLGPALYGQTIPDPTPIYSGSPPRYRASIEIDNDFKSLPWISSRGIPGLKVTAAHEFHHVIQLGSYGYWGESDIYFYEVTSTWMEDVVYTDVNDYLQYLSNDPDRTSQFSQPEIRFTRLNGSIEYSRSIWGKFIEKRYSRELMRRTWEFIRQYSPVPAMDHALSESGSSFREAFGEYAYWNLNTGPASDTGRFYSEGLNYPSMHISTRITYTPPSRTYDDAIQPLSSTYYEVCVLSSLSDSCTLERQMPVIITNLNTGLQYSDVALHYSYVMSTTEIGGSKHLANGLYTKVEVGDPQNWRADEAVSTLLSEVLVFPNPYRARERVPLWFRLPSKPQSSSATISLFTSSLDRVLSADLPVLDFRPLESAVKWDGRLDNGDIIASGIYIFVIDVDDKEYTGKFAAVRE